MSDKQPHRADDSITLISGALAAQRTAADACEDSFRRLAFNTSAACDGLLSAVSSVNDYVCKTVNDIRGKAKRMCAWRDKRLEWLWEELDGSQAQLEAWGRQLCVSGEVVIDWESIEESTRTAELFLGGVDLHPASSTVIFAREVSPVLAVAGMSHTQQCIDVIQSPVSHPRFFQRGERNSVGVVCRDAAGYAVRNLRVSDVRLRVNDEEAGWAVSEPTVEVGSLNVYVTPAKGASRTVALILDIDGVIIEIPLQAGLSVNGTHVRTLVLRKKGNTGLAISPDGTVMVISNVEVHVVSVYGLPDGVWKAEFGGEGSGPAQFKRPFKLCFSTLSGNILVTDAGNRRVQEVTRTGAHVRSIGVGDLFRDVHGIAAVGGLLVVTALEGYTTLFVFDLHTGHRLRSFGEEGSCEGELTQSVGVRFTPDGSHILIADGGNNRLSLFTMTGDFVRCIGVDALDSPEDVDFSSNGDILVADCNKNRVCVFSPDGSTLLRAFGMTGDEGEQLKEPIALAMHDQYLYVLDWGSARVQLFA